MKRTIPFLLLTAVLFTGVRFSKAQSWEKINTGYNYIFKGMEFPGGQSQIGWAGGQSLTYMGDGVVIKTTNGGTTWTSLWTGTDQGVEGISFPDMNTGYIGGWSAYFAKTTNGGVSWTPQNPGSDIYYYTDVVFKDANNGVVTAQTNTGGDVYWTSNGGTTWNTGNGLSGIAAKVCYISENTYFLVTGNGNIQKSTDGGATWSTVYSSGVLLMGIDFFNPMIGMAASEDGRLIKTYDGGVTWQQQVIAGAYPLWHDFAWSDQNNVYVCGTPEMVYTSANGGSTWVDNYPASTYNPALYEILFTTDGIGMICGSQGWYYRKAPLLTAGFTPGNTHVCNGGTVQFTDQSIGDPTGWNWTFEGGTPSTSTFQNPMVTYSTPGVYDVSLTVTIGAITNTLTIPDLIHVESPVTAQPAQPAGPAEICGLFEYLYTTSPVAGATSYSWTSDPASAGTFSGTGTTGTLTASNTWNGAFTVKVAGANACGNGPQSQVFNVTLTHQPNAFFLFSGGGYCAGENGYEIKLEDSDIGVDYQLYKDGVALGPLVPGTGNLLSFGLQTTGVYTVTGVNGNCFANMMGSAEVYTIDPAAAAAQPSGPATTCNNVPSDFTATLPANAFTLGWALTPASAGTISQPDLTTASVTWSTGFSGVAALTVQGQNECGSGTASPALNITVNALPTPIVTGIATACKNQEITYTTAANSGSNYVWIATGGTVTSGQGSNLVTVLWGNTGTGTVSVTETSDDNCTGISPVLMVAVNECTGISLTEDNALSLYPNPASDQLNIVLNAEFKTPSDISIYNNMGQKVQHYSNVKGSESQALKIDITNLKPGVYTLRIENENQILNRLFVKR